jgi:hypothetical protein
LNFVLCLYCLHFLHKFKIIHDEEATSNNPIITSKNNFFSGVSFTMTEQEARIFANGEDEDEDESWIPLTSQQQEHEHVERVAYSISACSTVNNDDDDDDDRNNIKTTDGIKQQQHQQQQQQQHDVDNNQLKSIQSRFEDRISIKTNLVDHPVDFFWRRFLINLLRQIWALEIRIRLGIFLLAVGLLTRIFLLSFYIVLYPRYSILSLILIASLLYIDPFDVQGQIKDVGEILLHLFSPSSSHHQMNQSIMTQERRRLDLNKVRRLSFVIFAMPTILEVRTFSFLTRIKVELATSLYKYNIGISLCISIVMMFLLRVRQMKPSDISYYGLLILYGSALLITIVSYDNETNDMRRIPFLAAPFLTATSALLLMYKDDDMEWLSRIIRHTFRLTLRDVLSSVGERVAEDEMLQLAILRWILDFWASNPSEATTATATATAAATTPTKEKESKPESAPNTATKTQQKSEQVVSSIGQISEEKVPTSMPSTKPHDIQWEELLPMLSVEIDHMEQEVDALQFKNIQSSGESDQLDAAVSLTTQKHHNQLTIHSLVDLKSMLLSFSVDDRAEPAVSAYRNAVESFPPKKETAVTISIFRRCPALITLICHIFLLKDFKSFFISCVILCPFIAMEVYRINMWMEACQQFAPAEINDDVDEDRIEEDWRIPTCLKNVNTMTILLSGDVHSTFRPPSLLLVWHNIVSSVSALEVGLSTARCAETTAVAVDFAGSAVSLVQFGFEISQHGLLHGLIVMVNEIVSIHASGRDINSLDLLDDDKSTRYTKAAIRVVNSGQRVVRNINSLSKDQNVMAIAQPFLSYLGLIIGHKWLWGKDDEKSEDVSQTESDDLRSDLELRDTKMTGSSENVESTDLMSAIECSGEDNERQASNTCTRSVVNDTISIQCDLTPKPTTPEEELSEVMDMVATLYERGLIEETEKGDFFQKLSKLEKEELFDKSVLAAMKRSLRIVLENGSSISSVDDTNSEGIVRKSSHISLDDASSGSRKCVEGVPETANIDSSNISSFDLPLREEKNPTAPHGEDYMNSQSNANNDNFIAFGVAAFGVVAGGVLLAMGGSAENGDDANGSSNNGDNADRTYEEDNERNSLPTLEIVELTDNDKEDDWVAIAQ